MHGHVIRRFKCSNGEIRVVRIAFTEETLREPHLLKQYFANAVERERERAEDLIKRGLPCTAS
jgi:hypothetical protein